MINNITKIKWPNHHCPQIEQCKNSNTRWMICRLRKEYISSCVDKERSEKENSATIGKTDAIH